MKARMHMAAPHRGKSRAGAAALLLAGLIVGSAGAAMAGPEQQPDAWYPSRYGAQDTIGAANNAGEKEARDAAASVQTGKVYSLAVETGLPEMNGRSFPGRDYRVQVDQQKIPGGIIGHDEKVEMWMGVFGTSVDGLGHVGLGDRFYNGFTADEIYSRDGLRKLSAGDIPPIVTRGVLLDIPAWKGVTKAPPSLAINRAEIDAMCKAQNITLKRGDVVLLHTGWQDDIRADPAVFNKQPGLGVEGARYLASLGIVAVGSDNLGVEVFPPEDKTTAQPFPVHPILLAENGIYILEGMKTDELARDKAYSFMFVMAVPKLHGTVQAAVHPIAIR